MNTLKFFALCLLATVSAFAQFPLQEQPISESSSSLVSLEGASSSSSFEIAVAPPAQASSSSSAAETKLALPQAKTVFDSLRGNAYNPYSMVGAAPTVEDLISTPSDINGRKFVYVSPTDYVGYAAFPIGSGTFMLGLDNSTAYYSNLAALILGYANSSFGIALNYSIAKKWTSNSSQDINTMETYAADNLGLYFSMPIRSVTLYANTRWITYDDSYFQDFKGYEYKKDYTAIIANLGLTSALGSLSYDGYLNVFRQGGLITDYYGNKLYDEDSFLRFALVFKIGYTALQNSTARLIVGINNHLRMWIWDKTGDMGSYNQIEAAILPNILVEFSLADNWLAFAGANHYVRLITGDHEERSEDTSYLTIEHSNGSSAFAGIRYQKTRWALEAQITANMFNNPLRGFAGYDMFGGLGGFVYF